MTARTRTAVFGAVAAVLVIVATCGLRSGQGDGRSESRLGPLERLTRGVWYDEEGGTRTSFEWGLDGQVLHERTSDTETRDDLSEVLYFWHPRKDSLAFQSVLADGEVREGILRPTEEGFEIRFNGFLPDGGGASYREVLRFLEDDKLLRSVHRKTETAEILDSEVSLVRKRR